MNLKEILRQLVEKRDLTRDQMRTAMRTIMSGEATPAQIAGFLVALRAKGETVEELAAAAETMRELAVKVPVDPRDADVLVDTCGTGGDGLGLFNVSTAAAFAVAAAGGRVAKHGNRAVSGQSGSADVLEAAGVRIELSPEAVARCVREVGIGFMFAPAFHGATRNVTGVRRELGLRTAFNLLGPLTNPAGAKNQVIGVFERGWLRPVAEALGRLGARHALVVHSDDGLDEISVCAPTRYAELRGGAVTEGVVEPSALGVACASLAPLAARTAQASLALMREALSGAPGAPGAIVAANAGAALYVCGLAESLPAGVARARQVLATGEPLRRLEALVKLTQTLSVSS